MLTDTDSLVDEIKIEDVYEDFYQDKNLFDLFEFSGLKSMDGLIN